MLIDLSDVSLKKLRKIFSLLDIREWLKSLRLHKYTKLLLEYSYEEFLELTDEKLERRNVTLGARGKIIKNIGLIKERPQKLVQLAKELEVSLFFQCRQLVQKPRLNMHSVGNTIFFLRKILLKIRIYIT